jgi:ubiquitin carboxyl-terminal hydrolase 2/21
MIIVILLVRISLGKIRFNDNIISDIFTGQLKSTLECTYCQYQSITFDMFWDLSIPLPRVQKEMIIE